MDTPRKTNMEPENTENHLGKSHQFQVPAVNLRVCNEFFLV